MKSIEAPLFDLDLTLESGQVFHWERIHSGEWRGLIGDTPVHIRQRDGQIILTDPRTSELVREYFALDHPLEEIYRDFPQDELSQTALASCRGLRIIRQPRWECLATFITSSMKQVAHIRAMSLEIRKRFGQPVAGSSVPAYPSPGDLAALTEADLRSCGLGYRAKNLVASARDVATARIDLDAIAELDTPALRTALESLPGVGVKVANCVLLFAYERLDAVPIDVWIGRILLAMRRGRAGTATQMARYARRRLGPYAGYVQQYLFHHARVSPKLTP
ncbi:MAG: DNA-3-methyladenine glycosylase family protein [Terrimicrobiaceae bacterium]